jgi:quaternary ammonium compound-resistance protein SugE
MAWIYLIIAAIFETAWTFSIKLMQFSALKTIRANNFFSMHTGLPIILPFAGYILFGIGNIYFFSLGIKQVPTAMAYAVWTAVTLILIKTSELVFLKQRISLPEIGFMLMIMIGILGLRIYATK